MGLSLWRSLLLTTGVGSLGFGGTSDSLHSTLHFLELLSSLLALGADDLVSNQVLLGVALLPGIEGVVDESETGGSASSELALQAEDGDVLVLGLEHRGELGLDGSLGDGSLVWVDELNLELSSLEKWVVDHLSGVKNEFLAHL